MDVWHLPLEVNVRGGKRVRVYISNSLKSADINTIEDLILKSESELLKIPSFGKQYLQYVKVALAKMDLHLKPE